MNVVTRNGIDYQLITVDVVEVTRDGELLGRIYANEGDWDLIVNGADPIAEGWEDGVGHPLSLDGWGD